MSLYSQLPIRFKILVIALIGAIGFIGYLAYNYQTASSNTQRLENIQNVNFPVLDDIGRIWLALFEARSAMQNALAEQDGDLVKEAKTYHQEINNLFQHIGQISEPYQQDTQKLITSLDLYMTSAETLILGMINESIELSEMVKLAPAMNKNYDDFTVQLKSFREKALSDFEAQLVSAKKASNDAIVTGVFVGVFVTAILWIGAFFVSGGITKNLLEVVLELEHMSTGTGDLTIRLETNAKDEIGLLVSRFNSFVHHLQLMIKVLSNLSIGVAEGVGGVRDNSEHTQESIESQQNDIQQVATAVTEMSQTAIQVSENAAQAAKATNTADHESQQGQRIVKDNIQSITQLAENIESAQKVIEDLSHQVKNIASASQDIRSIADQTNLLALNAAIEAARAGEQGRGFAVVADEVRTLASRTSQSTDDIEGIVTELLAGADRAVEVMQTSKQQASDSVSQSEITGESLQSVLSSIHTIAEMNALVASSASEQSTVADDVSHTIERIDQFSEQTVVDATNTTQASDKLFEQAKQLESIVHEFKV